MARRGRRQFIRMLGGTAAALPTVAAARRAPAQVVPQGAPDAGQMKVATLLGQMNETLGLGVPADEFERAKAYTAAVQLEARARLHPLVLDEALDVPTAFVARRRS